MLFATKYSIRGDRTKDRTSALMTLFGERGDIPGTVAHYTAIDGRGGIVIVEADDATALYEASLAYGEWLEMETTPIMKVEDAIPHILASLA